MYVMFICNTLVEDGQSSVHVAVTSLSSKMEHLAGFHTGLLVEGGNYMYVGGLLKPHTPDPSKVMYVYVNCPD